MTVPRSETQPQHEEQTSDGRAGATAASASVPLHISGETGSEESSEYAVLVSGELEPDAATAEAAAQATVTALETGATLLSGAVDGTTVEFPVTGELLGVTVDGPAPTITLDGTPVDAARWPTVHQAIGRGAHQEPVATPFPESGEMGKPLGDPLAPKEYVLTLEAADDEAGAYAIDVDGAVLDGPSAATVSDGGASVGGDLAAGDATQVEVRGAITGIETDGDVEFSIRPQS